MKKIVCMIFGHIFKVYFQRRDKLEVCNRCGLRILHLDLRD